MPKARLASEALIGVILLCVTSTAFAQGAVFRGPYLGRVTSDAVSVLWESPTPTTGVVRYGKSSVTEARVQETQSGRHHEVRLTGLTNLAPPGSRFVYELEVDGVIRAGSFHTAPLAAGPLTFMVYGDNRSSRPQHQAVVDALLRESQSIKFAVNTGDLVSDGSNEGNWDEFFEVEAPFLAKTPLFVSIGNHEVDGGNWNVPERILSHPTDVPPASGSEAYYRVIYGNVDLIFVNVEVDNLYTLDFLARDQEDWLERVIADRPAGVDHRFLFIHQGPYSSKPGRNGNYWLRQWLDRFKPEIDVIFSGHDHYAELGWARNGIPYVIHGGGGAPLYDTLGPRVTTDHTIVYGQSRLGYALVDVDGPEVRITVKGIDGSTVASFAYGSPTVPECTTAADCGPPLPTSCPGSTWECHRSSCRAVCPSDTPIITCLTDSACENSIGPYCNGTATCEKPGIDPRQWYCLCDVPPECMSSPDCAARPPPVPGCQGEWACVSNTCEFTPTQLCESSDAGVRIDATSPDLGTPDALSPDAESSLDATSVDTGAVDSGSVVDSGVVAPDATPIADASTTPTPTPAETGCGCQGSSKSLPESALLALLLLFRKRRGRSRVGEPTGPVRRTSFSYPHRGS